MHNKPSVSVSRDRPFRNTAKIGHDRPKQAVTPYRNDRSRLTEMGGHDGPKYAASAADFEQFLQARWCDTRFLCVRDGDRLVAAAVTDVTPIGLSAVYTFFDPDLATRSLGVFSILQQIAWAERLGLPHVYLGYWLDGHAKMSYKQHYQPREILEQGQWKRVDAP